MQFAKRKLLLSADFVFVELVALDKTVYPTFGVDDLLLTGIERMAGAADFYANLRFGGTQIDFVPAHAGGGDLVIYGVNALFHD